MRIEIDDHIGQRRVICTRDMRIAGDWFSSECRALMSADARVGDCRLRIWPETHDEIEAVGQQDMRLGQEELLYLAGCILAVSQRIADQESA